MSDKADTKTEEKAEQSFFAGKANEPVATRTKERAVAGPKPKADPTKPPVKSKPEPTAGEHPDHNPGKGIHVHPLKEPEREKHEREQKDQDALDKWEKDKKEKAAAEKAKEPAK